MGITKANKKRIDTNIDADIARNFRSSNTNYTYYTENSLAIYQNFTISDCFSFCKLSIESVILSVRACISSLQT